ncbi:MAG: hypothetical protein EOO62_09605, partial [Hymenobacter sp.]
MVASRCLVLVGLLGLMGLRQVAHGQALPEHQPGQVTYYVAPVNGSSQNGPAAAQVQPSQEQANPPMEQRRRISRSFRVAKAGQAFALTTRYGHVRVSTWNKPEMKVEAELIARAETAAGAEQLLSGLGVQWLDYDARTGGVAVSSQFGPALKGKCSGAGCRYEINYTVWL